MFRSSTILRELVQSLAKVTLLLKHLVKITSLYIVWIGFGGLGVACWPLVPKFAGTNPAEAVGFLRAK